MDSELLVDPPLEDGRKLIAELRRDGFDVTVAFWVRTTEEGLWHLYIGSNSVGAERLGDAYSIVYACLRRMPNSSISLHQINLVHPTNSIALDAIAVRDQNPGRTATHYEGKRLGNLAIEEAYIYPLPFPWAVRQGPNGQWQVLISEADDIWLDCESEEDARAIAAAPVLQYQALARAESGPQFAAELRKTADVMEKYRMGFGSRFFRRRAEEVRP